LRAGSRNVLNVTARVRSRALVSTPLPALRAIAMALMLLVGATRAVAGTGAILTYHHVSPTVEPGPYQRALTVSPQEFEAQLRWLRARGCQLVTVDRIWLDTLAGSLAPCEAALTFDDGYADVAQYALPLLVRYGAPGTFYIATGFVGHPGHMSVAQLRNAQQVGMEIGAHTVHHVDLTRLPYTVAQQEIEDSTRSLNSWLGTQALSFAYPAGSFSQRVERAVAQLHFTTAVTTIPGTLRPTQNPYALPRYRMMREHGINLLADIFGRASKSGGKAWEALVHIAHERSAGNDPDDAEMIAVALLARHFPEQILKVHVVKLGPATVAGVVLSGVKFHAAVSRVQFLHDVRQIIGTTFAAAPATQEVDLWVVVPAAVPAGAVVSGDYAAATERTVFSAAVQKTEHAARAGNWSLGVIYWNAGWL
jgi:peptidoglycan/xylan/chitin deacetylase (PgdA/CDA1 family)